ncbi:hypothetical protein HPB50_001793 [Hyalomma asiaticum]|uniref:Uncharacterized protein n=1 Tax=Hyalomma asiaticum TaxID=266040 RepID=A0ACB7SCZ2_HYAAI|nr:hypothetical protein HPB50_001793 [Hyalomma asiaticum]
MADQPSSSHTPITSQSSTVVFLSSRTSSVGSSEHSRLDRAGTEEGGGDDVVLLGTPGDVLRECGAQSPTDAQYKSTREGAADSATADVLQRLESPEAIAETAAASRLRHKVKSARESQGARRAEYKAIASAEASSRHGSTPEEQPLRQDARSGSPAASDEHNTCCSLSCTWLEKRACRYCLLLFVCFIVAVAIVVPLVTILQGRKVIPVAPTPPPPWLPWHNRTDDNGLPRILLWNPPVDQPKRPLSHRVSSDFHTREDTISCYYRGPDEEKCSVTRNRRLLDRSDAVVFYAERLFRYDMPRWRANAQMWVFWARSHLPSMGKAEKYSNPSLSLPLLRHSFNWTMGYRNDADVVIPYKNYYCARPSSEAWYSPPEEPRMDAAWLVDDCEVNRFKTETSRPSVHDNGTVRIRLFPACGASQCGSPSECIKYIAQRYYFIVVSLEPVCFQSADELIYQAFKHSVVPVLLAPPGVRLHVPEHSVVSSAELHGKGELAKYLRSLLDEPSKYYDYFAWKERCSLVTMANWFCHLCHALRETPVRRRPHTDVLEWWTRRFDCRLEPLFGLEYGFVQVL